MSTVIEMMRKLIYWTLLPFLRLVFKNSYRVYAFIIFDGEVLLIKNVIGSGMWTLPGGGLKSGENPKQALVREVYEETRVKVSMNDLQEISQWIRHRNEYHYRYYLVILKSLPIVVRQKREISAVKWTNITEAKHQLKNSDAQFLSTLQ